MERARKGAIDILDHDHDLTELFGCGSLLWLMTGLKGWTCLQAPASNSTLAYPACLHIAQGWYCNGSAFQCMPVTYSLIRQAYKFYCPTSTISIYLVSTHPPHSQNREETDFDLSLVNFTDKQ